MKRAGKRVLKMIVQWHEVKKECEGRNKEREKREPKGWPSMDDFFLLDAKAEPNH